jgi:hypothetical protein
MIMMISHKSLRTLGAASMALALVLGGGVTAALADTPDTAAAAHPHAMRGGDPLMHAMWKAKAQLNLNTSQQAQWDAAVALAKSAHSQEKTLHQGVKATSDSELAKTSPDLQTVAAASDDAQAKGLALHQSVRNAFLNVYANLSQDQQAMVANALRSDIAERQARMQAHHATTQQ